MSRPGGHNFDGGFPADAFDPVGKVIASQKQSQRDQLLLIQRQIVVNVMIFVNVDGKILFRVAAEILVDSFGAVEESVTVLGDDACVEKIRR